MRVEIERITFRDKQTEGIMTVYDDGCKECGGQKLFQCYTLELEEDVNARRDDCIPRGVYNVEKRYLPWERELFDEVLTLKTSGANAYDIEQCILKNCSEYRYKGKPILASGNTELFTKDVLEWF